MSTICRKYALTSLGRRYMKDLVFLHGTNSSNGTLREYGLCVFASWYDRTPMEARSCFISGVPLKERWNSKVYNGVLKASVSLITMSVFAQTFRSTFNCRYDGQLGQ